MSDSESKNLGIFKGAVQPATAEAILATVSTLRALGADINDPEKLREALARSSLAELAEGELWERRLKEENAYTDGLTGVRNRKYLNEELPKILSRAERSGGRVAFVFLDADHFKKVNDTFGHLAGDAVLKDIAQRLKGAVRTGDVVARYGGEEFAVIMELGKDDDWNKALRRLEDAMCNKENCRFDFEGQNHAVTCSVGVAFGTGKTEPEDIIHRADQRVYQAKASGRAMMVVEPPRDYTLVVETPTLDQ
ncbi:MAG: GGDEF domain-containing protein [Rhodospirillales bacterium]|nr:GGDEF domain-containing protein [Rhodospirillales bacterium]